jgi:hypothetical protein
MLLINRIILEWIEYLLTDREDNINQWRDKGGIGIFHTSAADTIKQLKELGL